MKAISQSIVYYHYRDSNITVSEVIFTSLRREFRNRLVVRLFSYLRLFTSMLVFVWFLSCCVVYIGLTFALRPSSKIRYIKRFTLDIFYYAFLLS